MLSPWLTGWLPSTMTARWPARSLIRRWRDSSWTGSPRAEQLRRRWRAAMTCCASLGVLFAGQTTAQYEEQARRYLTGALHPRFHCPYPMLTYQPMLELMVLLRALDFSVFMCTDSSRDFMRVIAGPAYGLRRERVIGSEVQIRAVHGRWSVRPDRSPWMTGRVRRCTCGIGPEPSRCWRRATQPGTSTCSGPPASPWWFTTTTMRANTPTTTARYSTRPPQAAGRCSACVTISPACGRADLTGAAR